MKYNLQFLIGLLFVSNLFAQTPILLKDINPGVNDGLDGYNPYSPKYIVGLNNKAYFAAKDLEHGVELWQSDGTPSGTILLKDIKTGPTSSDPKDFLVYKGALYFTAASAEYGRELWKTDGTAAGTVLVKDIWVGTSSSSISGLVEIQGKLFFGAADETGEVEPYVSDGTASGTKLLKNLPSTLGGGSRPGGFIEHNGLIYFYAGGILPGFGEQLWKTDGTEVGTQLVSESRKINGLFSAGEFLLFNLGLFGEELWISDGTASGTKLLATNMDNSKFFTNFKGKVFFVNKGQPWETDGTAANTKRIANLDISKVQSTFNEVLLWKDNLYFKAQSPNSFPSNYELYSYDGVQIRLVKEIYPGVFGSDPSGLTIASKYFVFAADSENKGKEVWKSDGTEGGTQLLADVEPGFNASIPEAFVYIAGNLFFSASTSSKGRELYKIDINTGSSELLHGAAIANIFPNPVESTLNFRVKPDAQGIRIDILDPTGTLIFSQKSIESIDVSNFAAGLYLVHVRDHQGVQVEKIIKQ